MDITVELGKPQYLKSDVNTADANQVWVEVTAENVSKIEIFVDGASSIKLY